MEMEVDKRRTTKACTGCHKSYLSCEEGKRNHSINEFVLY